MKKHLSFISLLMVICTLLSTLTGCFSSEPEDKEFSKAGFTITLNDDFTEQNIVTHTAYYVSTSSIVTALKEDGTTIADYTVKDYAELICTVNNFSTDIVSAKDGYAEFTYEKEANGKDYYYYARCFKNGTDFWLIQFACETKDKDDFTELFDKWASSVKFEQ